MKPQPSNPFEPDKEHENLLKQFRAYLHLVITAKQTGQDKQLEAMPGPNMLTYCRVLAELPGNTLAGELADSVSALFDQISHVSICCEASLRRQDEKSVMLHASSKRILQQLDFALALILRHVGFIIRRAELTECSDLLCEVLCGMALGRADAAHLVRRWQKKFPEEGHNDNGSMAPGSFPDAFAWDVYQRVAELDRLADEFPDHIRTAAQRMHAWPMLVHRHTNNNRRFEELVKQLEVGAEYPYDMVDAAGGLS
jgi:hypothetical protein